mmetsp:Transcript_5495/g.5671  ORF Transcript_5495/g.5671 Transcript_5495/m.5671 type:complete len:148 (-) Transcript_5495:100-543(-)
MYSIGLLLCSSYETWLDVIPEANIEAANAPLEVPTSLLIGILKSSTAFSIPTCLANAKNPDDNIRSIGSYKENLVVSADLSGANSALQLLLHIIINGKSIVNGIMKISFRLKLLITDINFLISSSNVWYSKCATIKYVLRYDVQISS